MAAQFPNKITLNASLDDTKGTQEPGKIRLKKLNNVEKPGQQLVIRVEFPLYNILYILSSKRG